MYYDYGNNKNKAKRRQCGVIEVTTWRVKWLLRWTWCTKWLSERAQLEASLILVDCRIDGGLKTTTLQSTWKRRQPTWLTCQQLYFRLLLSSSSRHHCCCCCCCKVPVVKATDGWRVLVYHSGVTTQSYIGNATSVKPPKTVWQW